ncbi:MAG: hypothetical protein UY71_C0023G0025 [Parcubacteria group bacterium GW2011_GWB1_52_7]|uniref:Hydrogenase maturation protease n=1 Tax=candidate division WWE3 bacterium RIFCSPLOWO2_02_FULL_53_10 TaxID=1802629 RepID=A0A1F4WQ83_UNCKA|nr:MAG: hypothetical protein UY64_C0001G0015 [Parcubacteria group bacterium GW2011_GWA1_51_12]KKW28404.1 MAG: hypothetical protein UY71_C0023G0025 [Parcubacteria group bacterium GW2011_GWB1_52_7]KKW31619.1 MAG: hypothetical protein UY75_C0004G0015 [Parcubacteria group bacterium GW2011_GWC2_52_8c]OGC71595.1 MAG: hypothetical protein A3J33_00960 [candidate division WWE3 bacterium RIFCSPLOWO2_02_FULL_53_10]
MIVYVFGNPDIPEDSLPLRILPRLRLAFPDISFEIKDPNEEWDVPETLTIIDTAAGIDAVRVFTDLESFSNAPRVSLHDFDALTQLRYLQKLGKLKKITVIGIPPAISEGEALKDVSETLRGFIKAS